MASIKFILFMFVMAFFVTAAVALQTCRDTEKQKEIASIEARVYRLAELLSEQRAATRDNVQRKQARTGGERDDDDEGMGEPESEESDADDDDDVPYNPKNLPLGWDGKVCRLFIYLYCLTFHTRELHFQFVYSDNTRAA
jgi:hypothetical protein